MEPNIRVKGFDGDWEERSLGEIFSFQNGFNGGKEVYGSGVPLISVMDVLDDDFITYDKIRGKAEVSEEEHERFSVKYGDVLFQRSSENVEDAGTSNVYLDPDHTAVFGGFVIRGRGKADYDPTFMKYCLSTPMVRAQFMKKAQGAQHVNISQEVLQGIRICEPSDAEQAKISEMLSCLGQQISLQQQKVGDLRELKKYMLQRMFPKDGEKVPEIRFAGFEGEWEQRKLGELYEVNNERNKELIGYDKTFSIATMTYKDEGNGAADSSLANYKVLRIGDIAFEGHTNKDFRYGRFIVNDVGEGIMSPRFSTLRPIYKMPVSFWKYYIHYEPIMRKILVCSTKAGTMMNELVPSDFFAQSILVPSVEEQTRIGEYFSQLDSLITHHQRKHDTLLEFKAYLLQNMFPKEG